MSLFQALYGKQPPYLVRFGNAKTGIDNLAHLLQERDLMLNEIQFNLVKAQQTMKYYVNRKRREVAFQEGDFVFLKLQANRQKSLAKHTTEAGFSLLWSLQSQKKKSKRLPTNWKYRNTLFLAQIRQANS